MLVPMDEQLVETPRVSWSGYSWSLIGRIGRGAWAGLHYVGEKLAYGLGITSPDWQYAIDIHEDLLEEEREEREAEERALKQQAEEAAKILKEMEDAKTEPT